MRETEAKLNRDPRRVEGDLLVTGVVEFVRATDHLSLDAADQSGGEATATIPDLGGTDGEVVVDNAAQTLSNKTLADPEVTGAESLGDNVKHKYGDDGDAEVYYDGSDFIIDPDVVGSGVLEVRSQLDVGADAQNELGRIKSALTPSVSTTAKTILEQGTAGDGAAHGSVVVVAGENGSSRFVDVLLVVWPGGGTTVVIQGADVNGAPSRTYSVSSNELRLTMGSSTYDVSAIDLSAPDPRG